jgi:hypothetical protein
MTPELLALAIEYGWGCPTCRGGGIVTTGGSIYDCPDCHGNRITEADRAEFERLVVETVKQSPEYVSDYLRDYLQRSDTGR